MSDPVAPKERRDVLRRDRRVYDEGANGLFPSEDEMRYSQRKLRSDARNAVLFLAEYGQGIKELVERERERAGGWKRIRVGVIEKVMIALCVSVVLAILSALVGISAIAWYAWRSGKLFAL